MPAEGWEKAPIRSFSWKTPIDSLLWKCQIVMWNFAKISWQPCTIVLVQCSVMVLIHDGCLSLVLLLAGLGGGKQHWKYQTTNSNTSHRGLLFCVIYRILICSVPTSHKWHKVQRKLYLNIQYLAVMMLVLNNICTCINGPQQTVQWAAAWWLQCWYCDNSAADCIIMEELRNVEMKAIVLKHH